MTASGMPSPQPPSEDTGQPAQPTDLEAPATGLGASTTVPDATATVEHLIRARLTEAVGGWRGSLETALPVVAFVGVWTVRQDLREAVIAAGLVVAVVAVLRLIHRSTLRHVFTAAIATAIAAWFAMRSGRAQDAFLPGILWNLASAVIVTGLNLARWPVVGFLLAAADPRSGEDPVAWRRSAAVVRVCQRLTWVLIATYLIRPLIMLPLYLQGDVALLGIAKIVLGWPLWVGGLSVMAWLLARGRTPLDQAAADLGGSDSSPARGL